MNDRQLRTFIDTADCQSFSKAASKTYVSTPALIKQINILEKDTGLQLFNRGARGITLTEDGASFYKAAVKMLQIYDDTIDTCKRKKDQLTIHIHNYLTMLDKNIIDFVIRFKEKNPDWAFSFHREKYEDALSKVGTDPSQMILSIELKETSLGKHEFIPMFRDTFSVLVTQNHPLAKLNHVEIDDLKKYKILIRLHEGRKQEITELLDAGLNIEIREPDMLMTDFVNDVLENQVVMLSSVFAKRLENVKGMKVFPTNFESGRYGAIINKNADCSIKNFIHELSKNVIGFVELP